MVFFIPVKLLVLLLLLLCSSWSVWSKDLWNAAIVFLCVARLFLCCYGSKRKLSCLNSKRQGWERERARERKRRFCSGFKDGLSCNTTPTHPQYLYCRMLQNVVFFPKQLLKCQYLFFLLYKEHRAGVYMICIRYSCVEGGLFHNAYLSGLCHALQFTFFNNVIERLIYSHHILCRGILFFFGYKMFWLVKEVLAFCVRVRWLLTEVSCQRPLQNWRVSHSG